MKNNKLYWIKVTKLKYLKILLKNIKKEHLTLLNNNNFIKIIFKKLGLNNNLKILIQKTNCQI